MEHLEEQTESKMKKNPTKKPAESWRVISVPIWNCDVLVYCGPWDSFLKRLKEAGVDPDNIVANKPHDWNTATTYSRRDGTNIIYSANPMKPAALIHELVHVVHGIMRAKGVSDEEAFAYTLEYLYKEATK